MKNLHENSPCCRGEIRKFGKRRRQCKVCLKTWRVWKRKRGRNRSRFSPSLLFNYLDNNIGSISQYAIKKKLTPAALTYQLRHLRNAFVKKAPWPEIPAGNLIVVADGMMQCANGKMYTFYFILLRNVNAKEAVVTPPVLLPGKESWLGWRKAFGKLSPEVKKRVFGLVCDGHKGLVYVAKDNE